MSTDYTSNQQIIEAAHKSLDQEIWDFIGGGTESETTLRRNRLALDQIALRPRMLRDVSDIDTGGTLLGHDLTIPAILAPMGNMKKMHPAGAVEAARAAAKFGTVQVISSTSQTDPEEGASAEETNKFYQFYIQGDDEWVFDMLRRIKGCGYKAFSFCVDSAVMAPSANVKLGRWIAPKHRTNPDRINQDKLTWDRLERYRDAAGLPLLVKGLTTAEDAEIAVARGVDAIWVSNHGGRTLDHGRGTIECLPEIAAVAKGKCEIVFDGGILRGTDIAKALALGADTVAIGKLQAWALGAGGAETLQRSLEILAAEFRMTMAYLGVTKIQDLTPAYTAAATAVGPAHEMSAFPGLADNRLT